MVIAATDSKHPKKPKSKTPRAAKLEGFYLREEYMSPNPMDVRHCADGVPRVMRSVVFFEGSARMREVSRA